MGPAELIVVKFEGNNFKGEILPALADLVEQGTIRIFDLLIVTKDEAGETRALELADMTEDDYALFDPLVGEVSGILSPEDVEKVAKQLEPNSTAGMLIFEHVWASRFADALRNAGGQLVMNVRIPAEVVEEVAALQAAS